ncbi:MAG: SAM hydroxide adenosyltransferase, partial [Candidatus Acidiferrales bacterium]
ALPRPKAADGVTKGVVLRVDAFGNLITNFRSADLPESAMQDGALKLQVGTHAVTKLVDTFARGETGQPVAYVGSSGFLEIAVNKANAARTLGIARGAAVVLSN